MLKSTVAMHELDIVMKTVGDPDCQCALEAEEALHMAILRDAEAIKREEYAIGVLKSTIADMQARLRDMQEWVTTSRQELSEACGDGAMYSGDTVSISWRKSERVEIDDVDALPDMYMRVKVEPDKTAIKSAIRAGDRVDGARIVTSNNIQIA